MARRPAGSTSKSKHSRNELMQAKMQLVLLREGNQRAALATVLRSNPASVPELCEFSAALIATSGYDREVLTPQTESIAARALARAMMTVFPIRATLSGATGSIRGVVATLRELRRSRAVSLPELAGRLGLGVDVVSSLEAGNVRKASIPDR